MAYSAEVMRRARARLAMAREDRESENREHLQIAYAQVPRLRQIDIQLRSTMAMAAQAAFAQGEDPQELLQQARRQNMLLQQERAELAALHFEEGYLDESPICDRCGGTGYIGSTQCGSGELRAVPSGLLSRSGRPPPGCEYPGSDGSHLPDLPPLCSEFF